MTSIEFTERIALAKDLLPLEQLIRELGDGDYLVTKLCPFHDDTRPSFSIFFGGETTLWKCHAGCGAGDQINYLEVKHGCTRGEAIRTFLKMAGVSYEENFGGGTIQ